MTPTDAARQLLAIRSDGNYDDFAKRHAGTIARALLAADETLTRAGWTKLDGAARWKPPVNKDAYAPKFFEAEERIVELESTVREYKHAIDEIFGTSDLSLIYSVIYNLRVKFGQDPATGKAGG